MSEEMEMPDWVRSMGHESGGRLRGGMKRTSGVGERSRIMRKARFLTGGGGGGMLLM